MKRAGPGVVRLMGRVDERAGHVGGRLSTVTLNMVRVGRKDEWDEERGSRQARRVGMTRGVRREGSNRASRRLLRGERFIRGGLGATALTVCESGIGDHLSLSHVDGFRGREAELAGGMATKEGVERARSLGGGSAERRESHRDVVDRRERSPDVGLMAGHRAARPEKLVTGAELVVISSSSRRHIAVRPANGDDDVEVERGLPLSLECDITRCV